MVHRHKVTPAGCRSPATTEGAPSAYRVVGKARSSDPSRGATPPSFRRQPPSFCSGRSPPSAGHRGVPPDAVSTPVRELGTIRNFGPLDRRSGPQTPTARCHVTTVDQRCLGHGPWSKPATQGIGTVRCPRPRPGAVPDPRVPVRPPPRRRPRPTGSPPRGSGRVRPALHRGRRCR